MPNNYDAAAPFYDYLAQLIFGKALIRSQRFLVENIQSNSSVLIVGGGTGWILEEIASIQPDSIKITYVEISGKMIALSKKRNFGQNEVKFIHQPIEEVVFIQQFDVILTPFLFDNFLENRISKVHTLLHQQLKNGGLWLLADFQVQQNYKSVWQRFLLQSMYWFFGWLCNVEGENLVEIQPYFNAKKYIFLKEKTFYSGFIISKIYQKT